MNIILRYSSIHRDSLRFKESHLQIEYIHCMLGSCKSLLSFQTQKSNNLEATVVFQSLLLSRPSNVSLPSCYPLKLKTEKLQSFLVVLSIVPKTFHNIRLIPQFTSFIERQKQLRNCCASKMTFRLNKLLKIILNEAELILASLKLVVISIFTQST